MPQVILDRRDSYRMPNQAAIQHIIDGYTVRKAAIRSTMSKMAESDMKGHIDTYGNAIIEKKSLLGQNDSQQGYSKSRTEIKPLNSEQQQAIEDHNRDMNEVRKIRDLGINSIVDVQKNMSNMGDKSIYNLIDKVNKSVGEDKLLGSDKNNLLNKDNIKQKFEKAKDLLQTRKNLEDSVKILASDPKNKDSYEQMKDKLEKFEEENKTGLEYAEVLQNVVSERQKEAQSQNPDRQSSRKSVGARVKKGMKGKVKYGVKDTDIDQLAVTTTESKETLVDPVPYSLESLNYAAKRASIMGIPDEQNEYLRMAKKKEEFLQYKATHGGIRYNVDTKVLHNKFGGSDASVQLGADTENKFYNNTNFSQTNGGQKTDKTYKTTLISNSGKGSDMYTVQTSRDGTTYGAVDINSTVDTASNDNQKSQILNFAASNVLRAGIGEKCIQDLANNGGKAQIEMVMPLSNGKSKNMVGNIDLANFSTLTTNNAGATTKASASANYTLLSTAIKNGNFDKLLNSKEPYYKKIAASFDKFTSNLLGVDGKLTPDERKYAIRIFASLVSGGSAKNSTEIRGMTILDGNNNVVVSTAAKLDNNQITGISSHFGKGLPISYISKSTNTAVKQ